MRKLGQDSALPANSFHLGLLVFYLKLAARERPLSAQNQPLKQLIFVYLGGLLLTQSNGMDSSSTLTASQCARLKMHIFQ